LRGGAAGRGASVGASSQSAGGLPEPISVRIPEACRLTGLSRSRVYELMKSGDIEFVKVGSSTLIVVESLRLFIQSRRAS
jgi:excisionase family DNA binding protein